ncbi:MAG: 3-deoxy-D-manno-octulosonic acid kinase [Marinobacter psychrophilus]|jgi:3-deoxy-D-manno-octulosonic acid kinase
MAEVEVFKREMQRVLLTHPKLTHGVTFDWFDPAHWGNCARLVDSGGRGGAWFLDANGGDYVLREYRRGGLVSRLSRCTYAFAGEDRVRSIMEFRMLMRLSALGFPVPRPIAAYYRKLPVLRYQAAIIVERIADTAPLADSIDTRLDADWRRLGQLVRRFHDAGVRHADLNCFNVLVRGDEFFLIDFDKGCIMPPNSSHGWKNSNLKRFARSIKKIAGEQVLNKVWSTFEHGYNGSVTA